MNGVVVIDKPADWTSMDVCAKVRGIFHERRVGHAGTLDPMATGILPVFVGRATRAVEYAAQGEKEYLAGLRLGVVTDTQDVTGRILETRPVQVNPNQLEEVLQAFRGEIAQVPPMYSAIKKNGQKLYELARRGQEVEREPRPVIISALEILEQEGPADFRMRVVCSKGTYVRTLCHDIGQTLGCGGMMYALRRTRVGQFTRGITLEELARAVQAGENPLRPVDCCFEEYPSLTVDGRVRDRYIRNGTPCSWGGPEGLYRVYGPEGEFLMLGRVAGGKLTTVKSFFEP